MGTAVVKIAFFGLAGLALWSLEHRILGIAFVVVVAANLLIIHTGNRNTDSPASGQRPAARTAQYRATSRRPMSPSDLGPDEAASAGARVRP
ncbi:MAG: hypothetical protein QOH50_3077 [Kribbellaceae bacterium]|nr:hypothetical protein [Kribbellaceae bacterium]